MVNMGTSGALFYCFWGIAHCAVLNAPACYYTYSQLLSVSKRIY
jgi:hypothetical protein